MKVIEFLALFSLIVIQCNVKAFLHYLISTSSDPDTVFCKVDNDCLIDVFPPCFCIQLQHMCGCQQYGVGAIHHANKTRTNQPKPDSTTSASPKKTKKPKKIKNPKKYLYDYDIDDDMIRRVDS